MKREEITFLNQLLISLKETVKKIEEAYEDKDVNKLNNSKKTAIQIQEEIEGVLNG
jgi:uncharacterized membrane protein (DUF106 family)